jgi:NDP-sugar pyrophosphorylase family protein
MAPPELQSATFFSEESRRLYPGLFDDGAFVWAALKRLPDYIQANLAPGIHGSVSPLAHVEANVYIGPGTVVEAGAVIKGPAIIGAGCEVRAGAYIRGFVLTGDRVVIGHGTELKVCLLMEGAEAPHRAYIGDSMLGRRAHCGACVTLSNFRHDHLPPHVRFGNTRYETGLPKFGAILGDEVELGCGTVTNPGTLVGPRTWAYPNLSLNGYYPPDSIIKLRQVVEVVERRRAG